MLVPDAAAAPSRTTRLLLMVSTMTLEQMARREGVSRERVRQLLARVGVSRRMFFRECAGCHQRVARGKYCPKPECQRASKRAYAAAKNPRRLLPRAVCAHCHATLKRPVRPDGKPSFCDDKQPCRTARHRWMYHNNAAIRAYAERYRRSERGHEVTRRAGARYRASKRGAEYLARRAERMRQRRERDEAAQASAEARRRESEARAAARATALAHRKAAEAVALARVQQAIELSRSQRLSERAIAAQLGVSRTIVHYWLHGQRRASALSAIGTTGPTAG